MKTKVGIICAGDRETAPLLSAMDVVKVTEKALWKIYEGTIQDIDVVLTTCGVCKVNAAAAAQILIDTFGCRIIINGGTCGGMNPSLEILDTVVTTKCYYWDAVGQVLGKGFPKVKRTEFPSDPELIKKAEKSAAGFDGRVFFGTTVTGEMFIDQEMREEINEEFSPLSVDMETAAIAHVCLVNEIPFIAVRTVTDTGKVSGLDTYEVNCDKASEISAEWVKVILKELENEKK